MISKRNKPTKAKQKLSTVPSLLRVSNGKAFQVHKGPLYEWKRYPAGGPAFEGQQSDIKDKAVSSHYVVF